MDVQVVGSGERVVLVHGSLATGPMEWERQLMLADHGYELVVPTRRAYAHVPGAEGAATEGEDYPTDAEDVAALLGDGAHLVGHSSGGIVALLAAASRPDAVRSLVLAEPPAFTVAPDHPEVARLRADVKEALATDAGDREFLDRFLRAVGTPVDDLPEGLLDDIMPLVPALRHGQQPWEVPLPTAAVAVQPWPVLVVSGNHHAAFTAMCDALAEQLGATHVVVEGAGHEMQMVGDAFNDALLRLWSGRA